MERVVGPGEQNKLGGRQLRRDHIRGAFSVPYPKKIAGLRVLLADDVITTGEHGKRVRAVPCSCRCS